MAVKLLRHGDAAREQSAKPLPGTTDRLFDEQAALKAKVTAWGLTLEAWLQAERTDRRSRAARLFRPHF
jgi:hypothetical protein